MKWKREKRPAVESAAKGSSWTFGRQAGTNLVTAGLVAAILCGPIALITAGNALSRPVAVAEEADAESGLTTAQQTAGAVAAGYVGAWLSASRDNPGQLGEYVDLSAVREISTAPWEYRDLAIASIRHAGEDTVTAVVAANVRELASTDGGETTADLWLRRYFQVTVRVDNDAARVIGLPAPVAAPQQADVATLVYSQTLSPKSGAYDAVTAFLGAYLAESGDIGRYITPGTEITAITPAPYVSVEPIDIRTDATPSETPGDGEQLRVLATVALANLTDQRLTSSYALTLTARAGRWEVTAIDAAPQETSSPRTEPTTTTIPTPSASTEGK